MSKKKKIDTPNPPSQLQILKDKFTKLKELRVKIAGFKQVYQEHDALLAELMPLFIEQDADKFIVRREITLGTQKYKINPHFYDEKKGVVVPKVWKSSAFPSVTVE